MKNIDILGAQVIFNNFAGEERRFNPAGRRGFSLYFEDATDPNLQKLIDAGFNVKELAGDPEEGFPPAWHLPVRVRYDRRPPMVYRVLNGVPTLLDEDTIAILDYFPIEYVDVTLNPFPWEMSGRSGLTAYAVVLYVVVRSSPVLEKWTRLDDEEVL